MILTRYGKRTGELYMRYKKEIIITAIITLLVLFLSIINGLLNMTYYNQLKISTL